jgi:hypothetical protein
VLGLPKGNCWGWGAACRPPEEIDSSRETVLEPNDGLAAFNGKFFQSAPGEGGLPERGLFGGDLGSIMRELFDEVRLVFLSMRRSRLLRAWLS